MKPSIARTFVSVIFGLLGATLPLFAQSNNVLPKLLGISFGGRGSAVLEIPPLRAAGGFARTVILSEGEREAGVEVKNINLNDGTVQLVYPGSNMLVRVSAPKPNAAARNQINLTNAPLDAVLKLFAEAANRTLLLHPLLPTTRLAVTGSADNPMAAAQIFAQALTNHGIAIIPDGDKFLQIVPQRLAVPAQPRPAELRLSKPVGAAPDEELPAGSINFMGAKISQVAPIYAGLVGRELDRVHSPALAGHLQGIAFKNQTPLTKAEIVYALDVQFAWRGVRMVTVDDKLVRLTLLSEK